MPANNGKRVLKPGSDTVFVNSGPVRRHGVWRLNVREAADGRGGHFVKRRRVHEGMRGRARLFHYIAAGGLRQLRRTTADDDQDLRQRAFLLFLVGVVLVGLIFYAVPVV